VCAWPEIFEQISQKDRLRTTGTLIRVTAEVVEYEGRLELQIQDWEDVKIYPDTTGVLQTSGLKADMKDQTSGSESAKTSQSLSLERKD
jgi:hypothetical protein